MIVVLILFIIIASSLAITTLVLTGKDIVQEVKQNKAQAATACQTHPAEQDVTPTALATNEEDASPQATEPIETTDLPEAAEPCEATELPAAAEPCETADPPEAIDSPDPSITLDEAPADDAASTLPETQPVLTSTNAEDADTLLSDGEAVALVQRERGAGRGPLVAINLDTIAAAFKAGETVTIVIERGGVEMEKQITLSESHMKRI